MEGPSEGTPMRYKPEWKGHLRVSTLGEAFWDNKPIGKIRACSKPGATTPKGMITDTVFVAYNTEFPTMTLAIEKLIQEYNVGYAIGTRSVGDDQ